MIRRLPPGYERFRHGTTEAVAHEGITPAIRTALGTGTLYAYAAAHPDRRTFVGRVPAYAIPLTPDGPRVVVRRSHHGGLLARITRDVFFTPTRAPYELLVSLLLARTGVPTPPVLAYAIYPVAPMLRRADVVTQEVDGADLAHILTTTSDEAGQWMSPVADLLKSLARAGAWHPDLNVKNILIGQDAAGGPRAYVLDVDRILFHLPDDPTVRSANFNRLARSLRKWGASARTAFGARHLQQFRELAFAP